MRIYFSEKQAPMLLDAFKGMNELYSKLNDFLASGAGSISIEADQYGDAEPYNELLRGLHIEKNQGPISLTITETRWLSLTGSPENLKRYASHFHFEDDEEGSHHHPDNNGYIQKGSMSLTIKV